MSFIKSHEIRPRNSGFVLDKKELGAGWKQRKQDRAPRKASEHACVSEQRDTRNFMAMSDRGKLRRKPTEREETKRNRKT